MRKIYTGYFESTQPEYRGFLEAVTNDWRLKELARVSQEKKEWEQKESILYNFQRRKGEKA